MHEHSLVQSLLAQVQQSIAPHADWSVHEIRVEIGPLAGVEPLLVQTAFETLVERSPLSGARLIIDDVPLSAVCAACEKTFAIERFHFACPACGSRQVRVTQGDAFRLISITIHDPGSVQKVAS